MRKFFVFLTLLVTSFFLFPTKEVRAATYTHSINSVSLSNLEDENFISLRENAIDYINQNGGYYVIIYNSNESRFYVYFFSTSISPQCSNNTNEYPLVCGYTPIGPQYFIPLVGKYAGQFRFNNNSQVQLVLDYVFSPDTTALIDYSLYLDSNITMTYSGNHTIVFNYNNEIITIENGDEVPTLYSIVNSSSTVVDPHESELEVLSSFYTIVFNKLNLLVNAIIGNYIYLSIFGVFVFIFVILLIRRLLL